MYGLIVTEVMPKDKNTPFMVNEIFGCVNLISSYILLV